ncbi:MAG: hypothetical protein OXD46_01530 [Chloroflexi bacterium]|nr:hypothetical protein [Chloroflexota bacterium]
MPTEPIDVGQDRHLSIADLFTFTWDLIKSKSDQEEEGTLPTDRRNKLVGAVVVTRTFRTEVGELKLAKQRVTGAKANS